MSSRTGFGNSRRSTVSLVSALVLSATTWASADEIRVLSGGGPQVALRAGIPEFERATGHRVHPPFAHVTVIQQKLVAGEKNDLVFLPVPFIPSPHKSLAFPSPVPI